MPSVFLDSLSIKLTTKASPIAKGKIKLFRKNRQINEQKHESVLLNFLRYDRKRHVSLCEYAEKIDETSHLYRHPEKPSDGEVVYFFPEPVTQFLLDHMGGYRPNLEENLCMYSDQTIGTKSYDIGSVVFNLPDGSECIDLDVMKSSVDIKTTDHGAYVKVLLELRSRGKRKKDKVFPDGKHDIDTPYRLESDFFLTNDLIDFRFQHKINIADQQRHLSKPVSIPNHQDIDNLNLLSPLIFNTGGVFALSETTTYSIYFYSEGAIITPTSLNGPSSENIYWTKRRGHYINKLRIPILKKTLIEEVIDSVSQFDGLNLKYSTVWKGKNLGSFEEEGAGGKEPYSINRRTIEKIEFFLCLNPQGLRLTVKCRLSNIDKNTLRSSRISQKSRQYNLELFFPWEVLIFRDFYTHRYQERWQLHKLAEAAKVKKKTPPSIAKVLSGLRKTA